MRVLWVVLGLLLLVGPACAQLTGSYNVVLDEDGSAIVTLVVSGKGTINVPMPLDVRSPAVRDALYVKAKNGVDVSIDAEGQSTIVYKSSLLTYRSGDSWTFRMDLPKFDSASVVVYVPYTASVIETDPNTAVSQVGRSKNMIWNVKPEDTSYVAAEYSFLKTDLSQSGESSMKNAALTVAITLLIGLGIIWVVRWGGGKLSGRQREALGALTADERLVAQAILKSDGIDEGELTVRLKMPEAQVQSIVRGLEGKKIILVERGEGAASIRLSEWFKRA
jgi:hypothetical protein